MSWATRASVVLLVGALALGGVGCGSSEKKGHEEEGAKAPSAAPHASVPSVVVGTVRREDIPFTREWSAQTVASKTVNVSSQVSGQLLHFTFREGARVSAGQVLFQVDPAPYQAAVQQAQAKVMQAQADLTAALDQVNLKKALADQAQCRANLAKAQRDVDRYTPLARTQVIPQQKLDDAVSARDVAMAQLKAAQATVENTRVSTQAQIGVSRANVESARAALAQKQIDLGYCTITSPVTGLISRLTVDPGNVVSPGMTTPLATISKNDPMYVDFNVSESDYLGFAEGVAKFQASPSDVALANRDKPFQLLLADGSTYPERGDFYLFERALDTKTGTLLIRAAFPNPRHVLKPGQFGRIRYNGQKVKGAVLVPQRSVIEVQSMQAVLVVDRDNKVSTQRVVTEGSYKDCFIVKEGLKGGERVVTEGVQKVRPGDVCNPTTGPAPSASPSASPRR